MTKQCSHSTNEFHFFTHTTLRVSIARDRRMTKRRNNNVLVRFEKRVNLKSFT